MYRANSKSDLHQEMRSKQNILKCGSRRASSVHAYIISSVQTLSCVWLLWHHGLQHARLLSPSPSPGACSNSRHWVSDAFQSSHPLSSLLLLLSIFPSIRVFSKESVLRIRWPKYRSFNFSISPSNEHSGLISFRIDWLDLFVVQGTLTSLL